MKNIGLAFILALAIASPAAMGYENCTEYKKKRDVAGYNACESRNNLERMEQIERERQQKEQKKKDAEEQRRRDSAERKEQEFREKQLEIQRQQLEIQKRNSREPTCDDTIPAQKVHEMATTIKEMAKKPFKKYISTGDCAAAATLAGAVIYSHAFEAAANAKANRQFDKEEAAQNIVASSGVLEFAIQCKEYVGQIDLSLLRQQ